MEGFQHVYPCTGPSPSTKLCLVQTQSSQLTGHLPADFPDIGSEVELERGVVSHAGIHRTRIGATRVRTKDIGAGP